MVSLIKSMTFFENNVEMKDEVQASLDRIESLVEAGNAKVDVTNNLFDRID